MVSRYQETSAEARREQPNAGVLLDRDQREFKTAIKKVLEKNTQRMSKTFYVSLFTKQIEVEGKKLFP